MKRILSVSVIIVALSSLFFVGGCRMGRPYTITADAVPPATNPVLVVLTYAQLDNAKRHNFDRYISKIDTALPQQTGLVSYMLQKEIFGDEVWTMTAWTDKDSLTTFTYSPIHIKAMRDGREGIIEFRSAEIWIPYQDLPLNWNTIEDILKKQGKSRTYGRPVENESLDSSSSL